MKSASVARLFLAVIMIFATLSVRAQNADDGGGGVAGADGLSGAERASGADSPTAGGSGRSDLEIVWAKLFAAPPGPIDATFITRMVGHAPSCSAPARIERELNEYRRRLRSAHSAAEVASLGASLETEARALSLQAPGRCRDLSLATYAAGSVALLVNLWGDRGYTNSPNDSLHHMSIDSAWVFVTIASLRRHLLKLEPIAQKSPVGGDSILGFYDCASGDVRVDPVQRPLNLAASIVHEFHHYFLDKNSSLNGMGGVPAGQVQNFVLLDETLASLAAGYLQRNFARLNLARGLTPSAIGDLSFFAKDGPLSRYDDETHTEQNLRSDNGPTFLFAAVALPLFYPMNILGKCPPGEELPSNFTCQGPVDPHYHLSDRGNLLDRVARVYLGRNLSAREQSALAITTLRKTYPNFWAPGPNHGDFPDITSFFLPYSVLMRENYLIMRGKHYANPPSFTTLPVAGPSGDELDLMPHVKIAIMGLNAMFRPKSELCKAFERGVRQGELRDYIGTRIGAAGAAGSDSSTAGSGAGGASSGGASGRPGDNGVMPDRPVRPVRPGDNGVMPDKPVRPGDNGVMPDKPVRPGDNGVMPDRPVRPGDNGVMPDRPVRPGDNGVMPGAPVKPSKPIRPCVRIGDQL